MSEPNSPELPASTARLRSGTAARLSGVPVATLRVWERRYGVVAAPKTPNGQRLYSSHDVQRLRLLKLLSDGGHAIGTIAALPLGELDALALEAERAPHAGAGATGRVPAAVRRTVVVGRAAAQKIAALPSCDLLAVHVDLDAAEAAARDTAAGAEAGRPDILLVHLASLQPASAERVLALGARLQASAVVVLYAFGAEALAESLRAAGALVRRDPVTGRELARLMAGAAPAPAGVDGPAVAARRFSDEALTRLAELPTTVACECPRHIAELVMQLAAFERYSGDCGARTPADAALHEHLSGLAGMARTLFERALERVIRDEGLSLAEWVTPTATA